jgi:hypothetical protein
MFQYLRSWFQMNDDDDNDYEREEEEQDRVDKEETRKTVKYRDEVQDTDLIKDRKRYRAKDLSKIKKVKKSLRFATNLTTKTKKRRSEFEGNQPYQKQQKK